MNQERIFKVLMGPHVSEKSTRAAEVYRHVVFHVVADATKPEIKQAVEQLFAVKVDAVRVLNVKGKTKQTRFGIGRRDNLRKAYVRLAEGHDIDFMGE